MHEHWHWRDARDHWAPPLEALGPLASATCRAGGISWGPVVLQWSSKWWWDQSPRWWSRAAGRPSRVCYYCQRLWLQRGLLALTGWACTAPLPHPLTATDRYHYTRINMDFTSDIITVLHHPPAGSTTHSILEMLPYYAPFTISTVRGFFATGTLATFAQ